VVHGHRSTWGHGLHLNVFLPGPHENLDLGEINLLFSMPHMASTTASATLCPFSLAHCLPWRTEGSRQYLEKSHALELVASFHACQYCSPWPSWRPRAVTGCDAPSEKYAARQGSEEDGMRRIMACCARAPQRCTSRTSMHFLPIWPEVRPISKTRNQLSTSLPVMRQV